MAITIGESEISCAYLGNIPFAEIYAGDTKIRPIIKDIDITYLMVGGGGGGWWGGGGGGEVLCGSATISPGAYCVVIGCGGIGRYGTDTSTGTNGGPSCFNNLVARGGYAPTSAALTGASGNGNAGGACQIRDCYGRGGGGGAGGPGQNGRVCYGGDGGIGLYGYGGGGGGGACRVGSSAYIGHGVDGGGDGGYVNHAACNATNCGGGGGGGRCDASSGYRGGKGGDGLVEICYPTACGYNVSGGCKYTCGDYTVHCFTSDGTLSF